MLRVLRVLKVLVLWVLVLKVRSERGRREVFSAPWTFRFWARSHFHSQNPPLANGTIAASALLMINDHRDLICWQRSDELRQLLIEHTKEGTRASHDRRFTTNLLDAIASACRNQSEGFYKYWHSEQRPLFNTARGSLGETKDGIQEGLERGFWPEDVANEMFSLCKRAMKANLNWLKSLKRRDPKRERGASGA